MATLQRVYLTGLQETHEFHVVPAPEPGQELECMLSHALYSLLSSLPGYSPRTAQVDPLVPVQVREDVIRMWLERRVLLCPSMRREWESLAAVASSIACGDVPGMIVAPAPAPEQGETGIIVRQGAITLVAA